MSILNDKELIFSKEDEFDAPAILRLMDEQSKGIKTTFTLLRSAKTDSANKQMMQNMQNFERIEKILQQWDKTLLLLLLHHIQGHLQDSVDIKNRTQKILLGLTVLGLIISIVLAVFITRIITFPLQRFAKKMEAIENTGDFSFRSGIKSKDEVGRMAAAFNNLIESVDKAINDINQTMARISKGDFTGSINAERQGDLGELKNNINHSIQMLSQTIFEVQNVSNQVGIGANELSSAAQALANGASKQAASLEEIASSMDEVGNRAQTNNQTASEAQRLTKLALENVRNGDEQMKGMMTSIHQINETSSNVSKVIRVIDEIAFQTNMLSLNAAVEAARAGKFGKGFGVVASEVGNLAGRSAEAAKSTTDLIETSVMEVDKGVSNTDRTAEVLGKINESINHVNDLMEDIFAASGDQNQAVSEINKGLTHVNEVVQNNSSISEQTASSSEELSAQAMHLQNLMAQFKLNLSREMEIVAPSVSKI